MALYAKKVICVQEYHFEKVIEEAAETGHLMDYQFCLAS